MLICGYPAFGQTDLRWEALPDLPVGVFNAAASVSGECVVVTGGIDQAGQSSGVVQVLDLQALSWRPVTMMSTPRCFHAQVTLPDGRVLVIGGRSGSVGQRMTELASCELIDPATGQATPAPPLPVIFSDGTAHVLPDGRVIAVGGQAARIFDPHANAWTHSVRLRQKRTAHASIVLEDGRVLVAGGFGASGIEMIDPAGRFSTLLAAQLPEALDDLAMVRLPGDRAWILGGQKASGDTVDGTSVVDWSNPNAATLRPGPALGVPGGMADHVAVSVGPWVIVAGGESEAGGRDTELTDARLLDSRDLSVWSLPALPTEQDDAVAVATGRGVIVIGGYRVGSSPLLQGLPLPEAVRKVHRLELPLERLP